MGVGSLFLETLFVITALFMGPSPDQNETENAVTPDRVTADRVTPDRVIPDPASFPENPSLPVTMYPSEVFQAAAIEAKTCSDLLSLDHVSLLEETPQSLVSQLRGFIVLNHTYLVVDRSAEAVLRFGFDGRYLGRFGRQGEGPGEFGRAANIHLVEGNRVVIADNLSGRLHLYDEQGTWLLSTPPLLNAPPLGQKLIWDDAIWYQTRPGEDGNGLYAKLEYEKKNRTIQPLALTRFVSFLTPPHEGVLLGTKAFAKVGNVYWVGSPMVPTIRIYDENARPLGKLEPAVPRSATPAVWESTRFNQQQEAYVFQQSHSRAYEIIHDQGIVWVVMPPYSILAYDQSGTLLSQRPLRKDVPHILAIQSGYMYFLATAKQKFEGEAIRKAIAKAGPDFDNPIILRCKIKGAQ